MTRTPVRRDRPSLPLEPAPVEETPKTRARRSPGRKARARTEPVRDRGQHLWRGHGALPRWVVASGTWAAMTRTAMAVLGALTYRENKDTRSTHASLRQLAEDAGTDRDSAADGLRDLLALRVIRKVGEKPSSRGGRGIGVYRVVRTQPKDGAKP